MPSRSRMIAAASHRPRPRKPGNKVTKPELGTKRICAGCGAKFYDLHKTPIACPTCEAVFVLPKPAPVRSRRGFEPLPAVAPVTPAKSEPAIAAENADGAKEAEAGVPLLEEMDED